MEAEFKIKDFLEQSPVLLNNFDYYTSPETYIFYSEDTLKVTQESIQEEDFFTNKVLLEKTLKCKTLLDGNYKFYSFSFEKFLSLLKKQNPEDTLTFLGKEKALYFEISGSISIQGILDAYPIKKKFFFRKEGKKIHLNSWEFKEALEKVLFSVQSSCYEKERIGLSGVKFELSQEGILKMVATDGVRLSIATLPTTVRNENFSFLVHSHSLKNLLFILDKPDLLTLEISKNNLLATYQDYKLKTKLMNCPFIGYEKTVECFEEQKKLLLRLPKEEYLRIFLDPLTTFSTLREPKIILDFQKLEIKFISDFKDVQIKMTYVTDLEKPIRVSINVFLLKEAVDSFEENTVIKLFYNKEKKAFILMDFSQKYQHFIMGMNDESK